METHKHDLSDFKTLSQIKDYAFVSFLNEQFDGNYEAMKREIKLRLGANTKSTYQTNKIKKMLPLVQCPEGRKLNSLICIKQQLKEPVINCKPQKRRKNDLKTTYT